MTDPWRYRCPEGHTRWVARKSGMVESKSDYYCRACQDAGLHPHFDELQDMKA